MTRAFLAGCLLAAVAAAAPDALKTWKSEMHRLKRAEREYWRDFQGAVTQGLITFREPLEQAQRNPDAHKEATYDYGPFRSLYRDYEAIQEARNKADLALAESGHEKALSTLFGEALGDAKRADALDAELLKAAPTQGRYVFDQRLGVERHGIAIHLEALATALAKCPDAAAFLVDAAWKRAEKTDGKRSIARRVTVIDAIGLCGGEKARLALEPMVDSPFTSVRIAALEALMRFGEVARPALEPLLADPSPVVRRALLQEIRANGAKDAGWIEPVLELFGQASGRIREDCMLALEVLTRQTFGYDPKRWREWFEVYAKEIGEGRFDALKVEVQEAKPAPPEGIVSFYGVETLSHAVLFVVDGSQSVHMPASWEVERTRYRDEWPGIRRQWEAQSPAHQTILRKEFERTMRRYPTDGAFGIITLHGRFTFSIEGEKKLLRPVPRDIRRADKLLERLPGSGWASQFSALREAARIAEMPFGSEIDFPEARADTVYLFATGDPSGGWYMTPEATLRAFRRFNRFRRLVVHAIRISDRKEPAETLMKGLAEASGGVYLWATKPPEAGGS